MQDGNMFYAELPFPRDNEIFVSCPNNCVFHDLLSQHNVKTPYFFVHVRFDDPAPLKLSDLFHMPHEHSLGLNWVSNYVGFLFLNQARVAGNLLIGP